MSGAGVTTGVAYVKTASPCDERPDPCVYFDAGSTSPFSAPFDVEDPWQIVAYNLPDSDEVVLQQVSGANDGEYFADVVVNGRTVKLNVRNNRIMVPFAGRFRLRYEGQPGTATVLCEPSNCCMGPMFPPYEDELVTCVVSNTFGEPQFEAVLSGQGQLALEQVCGTFGSPLFQGVYDG